MQLILLTISIFFVSAESPRKSNKMYDSYNGLVMAGYQGWFNTPTDGANRGWRHYGNNVFRPGNCKIDMWPDMSEYEVTYPTEFPFPQNGTFATVYSPYDESSVLLHFKWMQEYGIDGVFLQRFVGEISNDSGKNHFNKVMAHAFKGATMYDRAVCVMYDLSGMPSNGPQILIDDLKNISEFYALQRRERVPQYLFHRGKPLVVIWGVGFNDGRSYGLREVDNMMDACRALGFSVMLGVPTYWRTLDRDTVADPELHRVIAKADIVMPWFVGRTDYSQINHYRTLCRDDLAWAQANGVDYAPLAWPGFTWLNMNPGSTPISRVRGRFIWEQMMAFIEVGAKALYIAMFDEVDEGTAIFKCANQKDVPDNGAIQFTGIDDDLPTDHYLWLVGRGAEVLRGERPRTVDLPVRE